MGNFVRDDRSELILVFTKIDQTGENTDFTPGHRECIQDPFRLENHKLPFRMGHVPENCLR